MVFMTGTRLICTQCAPGQVQLILYPGFVFIISIAIYRPPHNYRPLTGRRTFLSGAIPVNHLEVEKIRLQSAPRPHLLVPAMPKSFAAPRKWAGKDC